MKPPRLMLSAVTRRNRHQAMAEINDAVAAAGGWIEGHTLFSNIATTFLAEVPPARIGELIERFGALRLRVDPDSLAAAAARAADAGPGQPDLRLSLNVTFLHDEPDLRRDVPMVPG